MGTAERLRNLDDVLVVVMDEVRLKENVDSCEVLLGVTIQSEMV